MMPVLVKTHSSIMLTQSPADYHHEKGSPIVSHTIVRTPYIP